MFCLLGLSSKKEISSLLLAWPLEKPFWQPPGKTHCCTAPREKNLLTTMVCCESVAFLTVETTFQTCMKIYRPWTAFESSSPSFKYNKHLHLCTFRNTFYLVVYRFACFSSNWHLAHFGGKLISCYLTVKFVFFALFWNSVFWPFFLITHFRLRLNLHFPQPKLNWPLALVLTLPKESNKQNVSMQRTWKTKIYIARHFARHGAVSMASLGTTAPRVYDGGTRPKSTRRRYNFTTRAR